MASKTVIVTGASQGIGAAVVHAFLDRGYNVVATSRSISKAASRHRRTSHSSTETSVRQRRPRRSPRSAIAKFGSIDHVVNNAGIFSAKPFTDYTAEDFHELRLHQPGRVHLHHPARSQADAVAGYRWQRDQHHGVTGREPHRGHSGVDSDDHQGRT